MTSHRYKNCFKNCKAMPGADCGSDHNPVVCRINIKLKKQNNTNKNKRWNIKALEDRNKMESFNDKLNERIK